MIEQLRQIAIVGRTELRAVLGPLLEAVAGSTAAFEGQPDSVAATELLLRMLRGTFPSNVVFQYRLGDPDDLGWTAERGEIRARGTCYTAAAVVLAAAAVGVGAARLHGMAPPPSPSTSGGRSGRPHFTRRPRVPAGELQVVLDATAGILLAQGWAVCR